MAVDPGFKAFVEEQLAVVGPVQIRSMFGGAGVFRDGKMFALIAFEELYFKGGPETQARYEAEGMAPFTYEAKGGKRSVMSYWQVPARLYDDPDEMREWALEAIGVAEAAAAKKSKTKKNGEQRKKA